VAHFPIQSAAGSLADTWTLNCQELFGTV